MNKRFKGLVALLILTAVFLTACGGNKTASTDGAEGQILIVNNTSEPGVFRSCTCARYS